MKRKRIPRPLQACLWCLLAIFVAITYYIALGCPTLSIHQEFRRAEKVHLVERSKIVDQVSGKEYSEFDTMLVGETDHGIHFFGRHGMHRTGSEHSGEDHYRFNYQKKTGDLTLAAPPAVFSHFALYKLPVYLFTDYPEATRAAITITLTGSRTYQMDGNYVEDPFDEIIQAEAQRDQKGFFRFDLTAENNDMVNDPFGHSNDSAYALCCISSLCCGNVIFQGQASMVIPVEVKFYDANGNLIAERSLTIGQQAT